MEKNMLISKFVYCDKMYRVGWMNPLGLLIGIKEAEKNDFDDIDEAQIYDDVMAQIDEIKAIKRENMSDFLKKIRVDIKAIKRNFKKVGIVDDGLNIIEESAENYFSNYKFSDTKKNYYKRIISLFKRNFSFYQENISFFGHSVLRKKDYQLTEPSTVFFWVSIKKDTEKDIFKEIRNSFLKLESNINNVVYENVLNISVTIVNDIDKREVPAYIKKHYFSDLNLSERNV